MLVAVDETSFDPACLPLAECPLLLAACAALLKSTVEQDATQEAESKPQETKTKVPQETKHEDTDAADAAKATTLRQAVLRTRCLRMLFVLLQHEASSKVPSRAARLAFG